MDYDWSPSLQGLVEALKSAWTERRCVLDFELLLYSS